MQEAGVNMAPVAIDPQDLARRASLEQEEEYNDCNLSEANYRSA